MDDELLFEDGCYGIYTCQGAPIIDSMELPHCVRSIEDTQLISKD
jgi:hypothetical protein